jgi:hypothetical protein
MKNLILGFVIYSHMRKLKGWKVFLEGLADGVPDEPIVKLDSVGSAFGTETGNLWPLLADGSVSWEDEIHWDDCDYSFKSSLSPEDRAKVDSAMVSTEDLFKGRVDIALMDYLSDVLVAEELTDSGYQVRMQAAVWNWAGGQKYMSSHASLPTVFMRVQEEGRTEDDWIRDFKRSIEKLDADFSKYGIAYLVTFHMHGDEVTGGQVRISDEVADAVKERVADEFPGVHLVLRQDVRWIRTWDIY